MSASVMHSAPFYGFGRMASVEELDSSLTLLSRHAVLAKGLPMTPPGTPVAQSPEQRFDYSPESPATKIPPNTPVTPGLIAPLQIATTAAGTAAEASSSTCTGQCANSSNTNGGSSSTPNIDNKIEQAMDLVKTHLTFAVREEIEVLKQTISELEQKVTAVESENQLLRQYAPAEVISNLSVLVQQQRAQTAPATAPSSAAGMAILPPSKISPTTFCSSALATTLNNVVADVRQQVRYGQPKEQ